ncbi:orotidine-5'-phosphate decarboxylase [Microbacterium sp.]|uniref:orotidine-5'-phosphate decarboxylase n=1 Tax=Microbacterium sp. TaxID=51671 RepID=UPI0039E4FEF3
MTGFGERLRSAMAARGQLCVGIDPHEQLLHAWGLDATAGGAREFGLRVVEAAAGRVAVVKPQVAFFERYGSAGFAALEDVLVAARAAGLIVIADAKRGDIGSTNDGYAAAWLMPGAPLEADALTVSPYLGVGALSGVIEVALAHGKGVFVLAATSNPEAGALQRARVEGGPQTVAREVVREVSALAGPRTPDGEWSSIGFVIGATVDRAKTGLPDVLTPVAPILAPGFGAQGAAMSDLAGIFDESAPSVLASASRSVLHAGPDGLEAAIDAHNRELKASTHG